MAPVVDDLPLLFDEIRELLAAPRDGDGAPGRERLEHTLTSGYARVLALEAERERIERRADGADPRSRERLASASADLSSLRELLEPLRDRARELRIEESRAARTV